MNNRIKMKINMANTYSRFYVHLVFAVKYRECLIQESWEDELYAYIAGIIKSKKHFPIKVNGHRDHVHILFDFNLNCLISDLVREIKKASTKFINENNYSKHKFQWQSGYAAFSVGWAEKEKMIKYIANQKIHHKKNKGVTEYKTLMDNFEISYNEKYLLQFKI